MVTSPLIPDFVEAQYAEKQVIIVGAGPSGLFLALKLVRAGIKVCLFEAEDGIAQSPRATTYVPIVLNEMEKVGIIDDVIAAGYVNTEGILYRTPFYKGDKILCNQSLGQLPKGTLKYGHAGVHLGQPLLAAIILKHAEKYPNFEIKYGHRFAGSSQDEKTGKVNVVISNRKYGELYYSCDFLVASDGAGSAVRKSLGIPYEGFTWQDFRFIATNLKYDFEKYGYTAANMIVDEEDWAVIARAGPKEENLWRIAYGVRTTVPEDKLLDTIKEKFEKLIPGPRPLEYELVAASPYWAHQRIAKTWRVGRIALIGDAAHSNNPIGGLGLTSGLLDSSSLGNCLIRIINKGEDYDTLLQKYADVRRTSYKDFTYTQSIQNKLRLHSSDPEIVAKREEFFDNMKNSPEFHVKVASAMNEIMDDIFE